MASFSAISLTAAATPTVPPFGFDVGGMDRSIAPGDDFNAYASGSWLKKTVIPLDQGREAMFLQMERRSRAHVRTILEDAARSPGNQIGDFYTSFLDQVVIDNKGIEPLRPALARLDAVKDKPSLASFAAEAQRGGSGAMFSIPWGLNPMVSADDRMPELEIFHLRQGGLGLPDRDYYLKADPKLGDARKAYLAYATKLLELAGERNPAERAAAVIAFETKIAAIHWSNTASRDAENVYNKWSPTNFATKAPGFAWDRYLRDLGLDKQGSILVAQPSAFIKEAKIWADAPLNVLKDHQRIRLLDHYAPYLSKPFVDANFAFHSAALQGAAENTPRWRRGAELVSSLMRDAVGQEYVRRYFPPATEQSAQAIVSTPVQI